MQSLNSNQGSNFVYWEKQGTDRLCGVHCINSLLQGPYYNEIQLAQIAQELDQRERELMAEQGNNTKEFLNYMQEDSGNVADDGNYSIQVLTEGLSRLGELTVESVDSKINKNDDLSEEMAFICNSSSHWFSIRKINNVWYNLNSTNRGSPEIISDFYLSAFLHSIKEGGYTIFVVKGALPQSSKKNWPNVNKNQLWFSAAQVEELHKNRMKNKNYKLNIGGTDERDLERAIEESLKSHQQQPEQDNFEEEHVEQKAPEEPKFVPFQGEGYSMGGNINVQNYVQYIDEGEDPELAMALAMSLLESKFNVRPDEKAESVKLNFRFPDGSQADWIFSSNDPINELYDFVKFTKKDLDKFLITTSYPKRYLQDRFKTLKEEGISTMETLFVTK